MKHTFVLLASVLQTSVSESTYLALLAARTKMFHKYGCGEIDKYAEKSELNGRFVCYCSDQAHSSVEKSALVALTRIRLLPSDDKLSLRGETLRKAIEKDKQEGLIPFFVCATLGSTGACAFDNLDEIGMICKNEDIWLHVDAAYAGSAFFCEEFRGFYKGIEHATSFVFNPSKWLMVNFDCTCFWVESSIPLHQTFTVAPLYLKHKYSGAAIDYMHWQVGLSRRFRALKLWFVLRSFGKQGIKEHIRAGVEKAKLFETLVKTDERFEIIAERHLGLVVFRLKGKNEITEHLLKQINKDGRLHVVPASIKDKYIIRFTVTSYYTTEEDIKRDWSIIKSSADLILRKAQFSQPLRIDPDNIDERFQSSLVLSNAPQTPKIVNASFVAFFPDLDLKYELAKEMTSRSYDQSYLPLIPRKKAAGIYSSHKGYSLDYLNSFTASDLAQNGHDQASLSESEDSTGTTEDVLGACRPISGGIPIKQKAIIRNTQQDNGRKLSLNLVDNGMQTVDQEDRQSQTTTTTVRFDNLNHRNFINKQASLDSKIQRIFEEVHDTESNVSAANNNFVMNEKANS